MFSILEARALPPVSKSPTGEKRLTLCHSSHPNFLYHQVDKGRWLFTVINKPVQRPVQSHAETGGCEGTRASMPLIVSQFPSVALPNFTQGHRMEWIAKAAPRILSLNSPKCMN